MYVAPSARAVGVASALLAAVEESAATHPPYAADPPSVAIAKPEAIALYERTRLTARICELRALPGTSPASGRRAASGPAAGRVSVAWGEVLTKDSSCGLGGRRPAALFIGARVSWSTVTTACCSSGAPTTASGRCRPAQWNSANRSGNAPSGNLFEETELWRRRLSLSRLQFRWARFDGDEHVRPHVPGIFDLALLDLVLDRGACAGDRRYHGRHVYPLDRLPGGLAIGRRDRRRLLWDSWWTGRFVAKIMVTPWAAGMGGRLDARTTNAGLRRGAPRLDGATAIDRETSPGRPCRP